MIINFVGCFQNGYVGEVADETHLARELEALGHTVRRIPRDAWREFVIEDFPPNKYDVPENLFADINIVCKWHHFYDGRFINALRELSDAPVFYWVWDYMWDQGIPNWHIENVAAADLYLGNDVRSGEYGPFNNCYYFPFDVADRAYSSWKVAHKTHDVSFFGSWIGQGNRQEWLREINKTNPITVFSWNNQDWPPEFDARPAVYGEKFNEEVGKSKIVLGFSVEPNCWGYWSNRVGKTLLAGGFLLYQYTPGMEIFLRDGAEYFSNIPEARAKINHYLKNDQERENIAKVGWMIGQDRFTSKARIRDLQILMERFIQTGGKQWMF